MKLTFCFMYYSFRSIVVNFISLYGRSFLKRPHSQDSGRDLRDPLIIPGVGQPWGGGRGWGVLSRHCPRSPSRPGSFVSDSQLKACDRRARLRCGRRCIIFYYLDKLVCNILGLMRSSFYIYKMERIIFISFNIR